MPRDTTVYRVFIASPSDVISERNAVREAIFEWNASHAVEVDIMLEPVLWESHSYPNMGEDPQQVINGQRLIDDADILIGIFWTRIGTETGRAISGAVEEIEHFIQTKRPSLIYFSNREAQLDLIDLKQLQDLNQFKKACNEKGITATYSDLGEFKLKVTQNLSKIAFTLKREVTNGKSNYSRKQSAASSSYSYTSDKERLRIQADNLLDLDLKNIEAAIKYIRKNESAVIRILDVGCADGYVTNSRFGWLQNVETLGIDSSAIAISKAVDEFEEDGFAFREYDIENDQTDLGKFDLIFCALTLHHLKNPEGILHRLWSMTNNPGVVIIRGADDGLKVNYPTDEEMDFLLTSTHTVKGSSDRQHGRKIYSHMMSLEPKPINIEMDFQIDSTVNMNGKERVDFFIDNYSYRANYAMKLASHENATPGDMALSDQLTKAVERQYKRFENDNRLFSLTIQNIGVAYKQ